MAKLWHKRILECFIDKTFTRKYSDVPEQYKERVKELFILDVEREFLTPEQYEEIIGEPYPIREEEAAE